MSDRVQVYRGMFGNGAPCRVLVLRRYRYQARVRFLDGPYAGRVESVSVEAITTVECSNKHG